MRQLALVADRCGARLGNCHWGYFDAGLAPALSVRSGDFVCAETVTHHAGDAPDLLMDDGTKALYDGIIVIVMVEVLAGLLIWKPVQFSAFTWIFYSFQGARLVHFFGMTAIVLFIAVHVLLALLVPKTLLAMITGGPRVANAVPSPAALAHQSGE